MDLTHEFTVSATPEETWAAFNDIASVAGCFPGAVVTGVEGDSFEGTCKVKLGPIALVYGGAGQFMVKDQAGGTMKIVAKGKDKRGNGTAGATVDLTMVAVDEGTAVTVVTDLAITGKPAQFGRGVIQDISDKLLGQFVACLGQRFAEPAAAGAAEPTVPEPRSGASMPGGGNGDPDQTEAQRMVSEGSPPDTPGSVASHHLGDPPAASTTTAGAVVSPAGPGASPAGPGAGSSGGTTAAQSPSGGVRTGASASKGAVPRSAVQADDSLDLGATVLPILLRTYGKQIAGGLGVLAVILYLLRRRH